jgi:hypothetical protein
MKEWIRKKLLALLTWAGVPALVVRTYKPGKDFHRDLTEAKAELCEMLRLMDSDRRHLEEMEARILRNLRDSLGIGPRSYQQSEASPPGGA